MDGYYFRGLMLTRDEGKLDEYKRLLNKLNKVQLVCYALFLANWGLTDEEILEGYFAGFFEMEEVKAG